MPQTPLTSRAIAFIDGQNLHKSTKEAFGYTYPNYDVHALSERLCTREGWNLLSVRFYTGVPERSNDPYWNYFWSGKLRNMSRQGVYTFTRPLRYYPKLVVDDNGQANTELVPTEKGIDVRIAIDMIRMAHRKLFDVALIFSQDQDLSEAAEELKIIAKEQRRWITISSAFPVGTINQRGINKTNWVTFNRQEYDLCLDPNDYRLSTQSQASLPLSD